MPTLLDESGTKLERISPLTKKALLDVEWNKNDTLLTLLLRLSVIPMW